MRLSWVWLALAVACEAEAPRGTMVWKPELASSSRGLEGETRILFLNRCADGCTIYPGSDDSRTDHSTIVDEVSNISPYSHDDADWKHTVRCVKKLYEPFEVVVTDVDPGDAPHVESIVAGTDAEIGRAGIAGIAPFACTVVENGINFNFANLIDNPIAVCNVVGQESGHTYGLDHQMLCDDPMTYLPSCGEKAFRRVDAECGEFDPRDCYCGGTIQNSYLALLKALGPRVTPVDYDPIVDIVVPDDEEEVQPLFRVFAEIDEDVGIDRAELYVDGTLVDTATGAPYGFRTPGDLELGEHELRVRAYDLSGQEDEDHITVTLVERPPRPDAGFFDAGPTPPRRPRVDPDAGVADSGAKVVEDQGCSCTSSAIGEGGWLALLVLPFRRRRR